LVQGLVHNMSGPLQILSMQMELMKASFARMMKDLDEECRQIIEQQLAKLSQIDDQVERLRKILNTINEVTEESATTLDVNQLLEELVTLWEGDLRFKHQVKKELRLAPEPLMFFAPPGQIKQGLCALFWWLVPDLVENNGELTITTEKTESGPKASFYLNKDLPPENQFFTLGRELLSPFVETSTAENNLDLFFRGIQRSK